MLHSPDRRHRVRRAPKVGRRPPRREAMRTRTDMMVLAAQDIAL